MVETVTSILYAWLQSEAVLLPAFTVWLVTFLSGENGAIFAFAFALQGFFPIPIAIIGAFLGSMSADLFWYGVTTSALRPWLERKFSRYFSPKGDTESLIGIAEQHPYLLLVIIKFLVGVRLMLTVYIVAKKRIPFRTYLLCNALANTLFVIAVFMLAALIHSGASRALGVEQNLVGILTIVLVVSIGSNIIVHLLRAVFSRLIRWRKRV